MKKISLLIFILSATAVVFADNENYDGQNVSKQSFYNKSLKNSSWIEANATSASFERATLTNANFTDAKLTSANFRDAMLTNANLTGANLTSVNFADATLTNATFTNAIIKNAGFNYNTNEFTKEQLYSTKSYQDKDLSGISFGGNHSGWDFSGQNLTSASFAGATLTNANLTGANLTSVNFVGGTTLTNANFTNAIIKNAAFGGLYFTGFTKEQLYSTKSYQDKDLSGVSFASNTMNLSGWDFSGQNLTSASFVEVTLTNANFTGANLTSATFINVNLRNINFTGANLTSLSLSYYDLSNVNFTNVNANSVSFESSNLTSANFTGANLTSADFTNANLNTANLENAVLSGAKLGNADFTNSNIMGTDLTSTVSNGFTEAQLKSTASYQMGDLRGVMFDYNNISNWDLSGQKLQNASFFASRITNVNFSFSDLRGADMIAVSGAPIYKTTIMSDGVIKNFAMTSEAESFTIHKYTPATGGGEMISAKISEANATVSGGAVLTLENGAELEVIDERTLTIAGDGNLIINTDAESSTSFTVASGAGLAFENGAVLRVNVEGAFAPSEGEAIVVMSWADGSHITGANLFVVDETIFLTVNGEAYAGDWNYKVADNQFQIVFEQIPEPAFWAAVLGVFALAFAARRRRAK